MAIEDPKSLKFHNYEFFRLKDGRLLLKVNFADIRGGAISIFESLGYRASKLW